jgi:hypothetical protein
MDRLDLANVARVVARMDAIAAAQAHPIAVTDSVHWRFPLFWVFFATFVRCCHDGFGSPTGLALPFLAVLLCQRAAEPPALTQ